MPSDFDFRADLNAYYPNAGPDWRAAIDFGIDVTLLERNLSLTIEERLQQLDDMHLLRSLLAPPERDDATPPELK